MKGGDVILLKGSRKMQLEKVAESLKGKRLQEL
jgi:UDP-N-acetylmuramyl pentapeptide synthase